MKKTYHVHRRWPNLSNLNPKFPSSILLIVEKYNIRWQKGEPYGSEIYKRVLSEAGLNYTPDGSAHILNLDNDLPAIIYVFHERE